jgi:hypothetical protein
VKGGLKTIHHQPTAPAAAAAAAAATAALYQKLLIGPFGWIMFHTSSTPWTNSQQPWIYFLTGALVPSIAYFFHWKYFCQKANNDHDDDDDDDDHDDDYDSVNDTETDTELFGVSKSGPSSKWNISDAPYKAS